jgi:hypothetical protein
MTNPAVTEALDILSKHHDLGYDCSEWQMCDALATIRAALDHAAEVEARLTRVAREAIGCLACDGPDSPLVARLSDEFRAALSAVTKEES